MERFAILIDKKIVIKTILIIVGIAFIAISENIKGIWQTETESEFDLRISLSNNDSGCIKWRAKDMQTQTAICSTWVLKWEKKNDILIISTKNDSAEFKVLIEKDYENNSIMILKPISNKNSILNYKFYKFGDIKRFKDKWEKYKCKL